MYFNQLILIYKDEKKIHSTKLLLYNKSMAIKSLVEPEV